MHFCCGHKMIQSLQSLVFFFSFEDDVLFQLIHREVWVACHKSILVCVYVCVSGDPASLTHRSNTNTTHPTSRHCIPKVQFSGWLDEDKTRQAETGEWTRCIRGFDASPWHTRGKQKETQHAFPRW